MATIEQARKLVRVVWPNAQSLFDELCALGKTPESAAFQALDSVEGLVWSLEEALEAAGLENW